MHCSRTVERGTRDSSPQGGVYGVSGNSASHTGPDFQNGLSDQVNSIFCNVPSAIISLM